MIDYQTYHRIHHLHSVSGLNATQIAAEVKLSADTVSYWLKQPKYRPRLKSVRTSILDPYRSEIAKMLERFPYSARQVFQKVRELGYPGSYNQVKRLVKSTRPKPAAAFLELTFAPGEAVQVDWTFCGYLKVDGATRRLSCFVMVLCHSRRLYVEFSLRETMEHFLQCHRNALEYFGGAPHTFIVDNCKTAVLHHHSHGHVVENPRYLEFAQYYGKAVRACTPRKGNEKGRVESGCKYVKGNFLAGRARQSLNQLNADARHWMQTVANVRVHEATRRQPDEMFHAAEKMHLLPLPAAGYDCAVAQNVLVHCQCRVNFDGNRYSVPHTYASQPLVMLRYPERLLFYSDKKLVAEHVRSYGRNQPVKNPEHEKPLLEHRRRARNQSLVRDFLALAPIADTFYQHLAHRHPVNTNMHLRKIMLLTELYSIEAVTGALATACELAAFHSDYIASLLEQRQRFQPPAGKISIHHHPELLDMRLGQPNMDAYRIDTDSPSVCTTP